MPKLIKSQNCSSSGMLLFRLGTYLNVFFTASNFLLRTFLIPIHIQILSFLFFFFHFFFVCLFVYFNLSVFSYFLQTGHFIEGRANEGAQQQQQQYQQQQQQQQQRQPQMLVLELRFIRRGRIQRFPI